jgi:hypothetical protein
MITGGRLRKSTTAAICASPDGYLYVSGDEGDQNDAGNNSQHIDKDFSRLLRIDAGPATGHPAAELASRLHKHLFNSSGQSICGRDPVNGRAVDRQLFAPILRGGIAESGASHSIRSLISYCGDVGGDLREEVNIIGKGEYGWAYREGTVMEGFSGATASSIPPINSIARHGHEPGNSITGHRLSGPRLSLLSGAYVFGDYARDIWALRYDGTNTVPFQSSRDQGIAAFGTDPRNSDILLADHDEGQIKRLVYSENPRQPLPPTLADTGASQPAALAPRPGIVPYAVNVPLVGWSAQDALVSCRT